MTSPLPTGERIAWVDTAKGICIILVVMMHATLGLGEAVGREGWMHEVVAFAKPFRMPDFFLVSGLFLGRAVTRDWRIFADRRIVHFLYFYLVWYVIQFAMKGWGLAGGDPAELVRLFALGFIEPFGTLWFIYMLAVYSVAVKLLRRLPPVALLAGAAALQIAHIESGWLAIDAFAAYFVYFAAGYVFAPRVFAIAAWAGRNALPALLGLGLWALGNGFAAFTPSGVSGHETIATLPGVSLALGLAGAVAITAVAALLVARGLAGPLTYCGERSIVVYLAFFLPMAAMRVLLVKTGLVDVIGVGWGAALVTAAGVVAPLVFERLIRGTVLDVLFVRPRACHIAAPARLAPAG
ncbi:putative membrane protein YcfT [Chelatococcus caeni]|uniref:Putative membrane protein YcfT n=1 Tax=Chelatococcus caeni TaxID=1348468 RepID=A0A840BVJ0_9HYPH|nr:acyltransferase family protein [Chelatococcus caeni]MBB4016990.1 putative membrane protein YcfT [Chelatococcus caeni]